MTSHFAPRLSPDRGTVIPRALFEIVVREYRMRCRREGREDPGPPYNPETGAPVPLRWYGYLLVPEPLPVEGGNQAAQRRATGKGTTPAAQPSVGF